MEGRIRNQPISVDIQSECAHCGRELRLRVDSELRWSLADSDAEPLVFEPEVDWETFSEPNITHAY